MGELRGLALLCGLLFVGNADAGEGIEQGAMSALVRIGTEVAGVLCAFDENELTQDELASSHAIALDLFRRREMEIATRCEPSETGEEQCEPHGNPASDARYAETRERDGEIANRGLAAFDHPHRDEHALAVLAATNFGLREAVAHL